MGRLYYTKSGDTLDHKATAAKAPVWTQMNARQKLSIVRSRSVDEDEFTPVKIRPKRVAFTTFIEDSNSSSQTEAEENKNFVTPNRPIKMDDKIEDAPKLKRVHQE